MNQTPDISVIIAAYNVQNYIERTVQSALAQSGVSVEVIIVDDCSTDDTWQVIQSIGDPRVRAMRSERNGGPSKARNLALAHAQGTWIAILDGDDYFIEGRLARLKHLAESQQAAVVIDNQRIENEADGVQSEMFPRTYLESIPLLTLDELIASNTDFISSGYGLGYMKPMFRRDFIKERGIAYSESIRIGEDYVLMFELLASGAQCAVDSEMGYAYTVRAHSISHRLTPVDVALIQSEDDRLLRKYTLSDKAMERQEIRARNLVEAHAYNTMVQAIKGGDYRQFAAVACAYPHALRHLAVPISNRVKRIVKLDTIKSVAA